MARELGIPESKWIFLYAAANLNDIWNITEQQKQETINTKEPSQDINESGNKILENSIYKMQPKKVNNQIEFDQNLVSDEVRILGLYDPEDNGLDINMWSNSDGDQLKNIFAKLKKIEFSDDAKEIMNISVLTNSHYPKKNISSEEFLQFKSDWLIKNSDLDLIKTYLLKNQIVDVQPKLTKFLIDEYLSNFEIKKACEIFSKNLKPINDDYLLRFNIYCLIKDGKDEEAQLIYDLKKEMGFKNEYFENKISYLFKYTDKVDEIISEKTIFDFHLAHQTNPDFFFEPNESTKKIIWKYLSSANLLSSFREIEISELDRISVIENAVHNRNYPEKDLFQIYKRFQFNINQLLNVKQSYKLLKNVESRALLYQGILINSDIDKKLELSKLLKESFIKDEKGNAFNNELVSILEKIDEKDVPLNYSRFYKKHVQTEKSNLKKIKINNKVIHQSKLINYLKGDLDEDETKKDLNDILKKVKKNKKYFVSIKDIILLETLKSDGIKFDKKYDSLYEVDDSNMPSDLQKLIENEESGLVLLRLVQILGQDNFEDLGSETLLFIVSALNQLNIDKLRNKILLKVLPLKV